MNEATVDDLLAEQRTTNSILREAFRRELEQIVDALKRDGGNAAIVDALVDGGTTAGDLTNSVSKATKLKTRTVQERLAALVESGVILREGAGPTTSYQMGNLLTSGQVARIRSSVA